MLSKTIVYLKEINNSSRNESNQRPVASQRISKTHRVKFLSPNVFDFVVEIKQEFIEQYNFGGRQRSFEIPAVCVQLTCIDSEDVRSSRTCLGLQDHEHRPGDNYTLIERFECVRLLHGLMALW